MIRLAAADDIPAIIEHGRTFNGFGVTPGEFNPQHFAGVVSWLIEHPEAAVFVSPTGSGAYMLARLLLSGQVLAQEFWWFDEGHNGRALREAMEASAKEAGAKHILFSCEYELRGPVVSRALQMAGYKPQDMTHIKEL